MARDEVERAIDLGPDAPVVADVDPGAAHVRDETHVAGVGYDLPVVQPLDGKRNAAEHDVLWGSRRRLPLLRDLAQLARYAREEHVIVRRADSGPDQPTAEGHMTAAPDDGIVQRAKLDSVDLTGWLGAGLGHQPDVCMGGWRQGHTQQDQDVDDLHDVHPDSPLTLAVSITSLFSITQCAIRRSRASSPRVNSLPA